MRPPSPPPTPPPMAAAWEVECWAGVVGLGVGPAAVWPGATVTEDVLLMRVLLVDVDFVLVIVLNGSETADVSFRKFKP